jgi:nucleoporin POM152
MVVDALCVLGLAQLRIPRITYSKSALALQLSLLAALDGLLFGGLVVDVGLSPFVGSFIHRLPHRCTH